jgi:hypothetical protein
MPSPILDAMPSIHATLIGFGGAFYSAFAVYAYQRLFEAKDKLDRVLRDVEEFGTPNTFYGGPAEHLHTLTDENGQLDWAKIQRFLHEAKSKFFHLDFEQRYGPTRDGHFQEPSDAEVVETSRKLCMVLSYVLVSYPFLGKSILHIEGITNVLEARKQEPFDRQRLSELGGRLSWLQWYWETSRLSILELARRATQAERAASQQKQQIAFENHIAQHPGIAEQEKERIWKQFYLPHLVTTDQGKVISEYFDKVSAYQGTILPALGQSLRLHDLYNTSFRVKQRSLWMIGLTAYILSLGIFLPPTMQSARSDLGLCWPAWVEYALLAATSAPYFWVSAWLWLRVRKSSFQ